MSGSETEPLLARQGSHETEGQDSESIASRIRHERDIDNDVVPETSVQGRTLGLWSAYILAISRVLGSGIFAMPGTVIRGVGSPGLALVLWIVGAFLAWAALAIFLEYGCMLPRSGGTKVYLEYTYRRPRFFASTMVAIDAVLLGFTATNCIIFSKYLLFALDEQLSDLAVKSCAAGLLLFITIVHGCFYKTGIFIQNVLGGLKIALILFMIATGLATVLLKSPPHRRQCAEPDNPTQPQPAAFKDWFSGSDWALNSLATALLKVFYSYAGLDNVNNVLNEVKNPVRVLKISGPAALLTACLMYVLTNVAYLFVVPLEDIKKGGEMIAALFFERIFGAKIGGIFLPIVIALSAAGNVMVVAFTSARVKQEVARQGFLPYADFFASSRPFGAPLGAFVLHFVPSFLVIVLPPSDTVYSFIADTEGYWSQFFGLGIAAGLIWLRKTKPELNRPFKAWLPIAWFRIVLAFFLIIAPFFPSQSGENDVSFFHATYALVAIGIFLIGAIYWYFWTRALPRWRGYRLNEEVDVLVDGTTVTRLVREKID